MDTWKTYRVSFHAPSENTVRGACAIVALVGAFDARMIHGELMGGHQNAIYERVRDTFKLRAACRDDGQP